MCTGLVLVPVLAKPASVELLIYVAAAVSGGIVARLHRKYWVAMLSLYAASVLLFECGMISWMVYQSGAPHTPSHALR